MVWWNLKLETISVLNAITDFSCVVLKWLAQGHLHFLISQSHRGKLMNEWIRSTDITVVSHQTTISLVPINEWRWVHSTQSSLIILQLHPHQLGLGGEKEIEFHPKSNQFLPLAKTIYITPPHPAHLSQEPFRCRKDQTTLTPAGATARSSSFPSSCSLETGTTVFCSQDTKKNWGRARLSCRLLLEQCPHAWCLREEGLRPHRPYHKPSSLTLRPGTSQAAFQHSQSTG